MCTGALSSGTLKTSELLLDETSFWAQIFLSFHRSLLRSFVIVGGFLSALVLCLIYWRVHFLGDFCIAAIVVSSIPTSMFVFYCICFGDLCFEGVNLYGQ